VYLCFACTFEHKTGINSVIPMSRKTVIAKGKLLAVLRAAGDGSLEAHLVKIVDFDRLGCSVVDVDPLVSQSIVRESWESLMVIDEATQRRRGKAVWGLYYLNPQQGFTSCYYAGAYIGLTEDDNGNEIQEMRYTDGSHALLPRFIDMFGHVVPGVIAGAKCLEGQKAHPALSSAISKLLKKERKTENKMLTLMAAQQREKELNAERKLHAEFQRKMQDTTLTKEERKVIHDDLRQQLNEFQSTVAREAREKEENIAKVVSTNLGSRKRARGSVVGENSRQQTSKRARIDMTGGNSVTILATGPSSEDDVDLLEEEEDAAYLSTPRAMTAPLEIKTNRPATPDSPKRDPVQVYMHVPTNYLGGTATDPSVEKKLAQISYLLPFPKVRVVLPATRPQYLTTANTTTTTANDNVNEREPGYLSALGRFHNWSASQPLAQGSIIAAPYVLDSYA
jgi:hypothetical protein